MKRYLICIVAATLAVSTAKFGKAICVTPKQLQGAAAKTAQDKAHEMDKSDTFVTAVLSLLGITIKDLKKELKDDKSWQKLSPKDKDKDTKYQGTDDDWAKLVLKRVEFWASDGEIVVAVKGDDIALLVPTPTPDQTDAAGKGAWAGFRIPYAAYGDGKKATASGALSKIFGEASSPNDFVFYRYKM